MSLLEDLRRHNRRIDIHRQATQQAPIRENANRARQECGTVLEGWKRLNELAALPADIAPDATGNVVLAREQLQRLLNDFDEFGAGTTQPGLVRWANNFPRVAAQLEQLVVQVELSAHHTIAQRQTAIDNAEFLARELHVESGEMANARASVRLALAEVEAHLSRSRAPAARSARSWQTVWDSYEQVAGIQACLRVAKLPQELEGTMQTLLSQGSVSLADVDSAALAALTAAPALARLCTIQLRRDRQR